MKIYPDTEEPRRVIIDFEGAEINIEDGSCCNALAIRNLFNVDCVSEVKNGVWNFNDKNIPLHNQAMLI